MAELTLAELGAELGLRVVAQTLRDIEEKPALLDGGLAVSLPYHVAALRKVAPRASILIVTLEVEAPVRDAIADLPKGAIALVVSHAETVLPFATTLISSLRGDEVLVEARALSDTRGWKRLVAAADIVFADVLSEKRGARVASAPPAALPGARARGPGQGRERRPDRGQPVDPLPAALPETCAPRRASRGSSCAPPKVNRARKAKVRGGMTWVPPKTDWML